MSRPATASSRSSTKRYLQASDTRIDAHRLAAAGGRALAGALAGVGDPGRHVARREERVGVGVEERDVGRRRGGEPVQLGEAGVPDARALLLEPQAHDVLEQPDRAVDAALVREVRRARVVAQDRLGQLQAEQATTCRSRGSRRARRAPARRRTRRRCRGPRRRTPARRRAAWWGRSGAERRAGLDDVAEQAAGQPEPLGEPARPGPGAPRRAVRWSTPRSPRSRARRRARARAGRDERDPLGAGERGRALVGEQLEDGVDRHRLDAGRGVELGGGHARERALVHPLRAAVAVVERQPEHAVAPSSSA